MDGPIALSEGARSTAGILLLSIVGIEWGGYYLLGIVRGRHPVTPFQQSFARAGHAHAGVLVTLALVCQILADAAPMTGPLATLARNGIPTAAILIPAGFFFSSAGRGVTEPNRFICLLYAGVYLLYAGVYLLYAGVAVLALGVVALGIGLLRT